MNVPQSALEKRLEFVSEQLLQYQTLVRVLVEQFGGKIELLQKNFRGVSSDERSKVSIYTNNDRRTMVLELVVDGERSKSLQEMLVHHVDLIVGTDSLLGVGTVQKRKKKLSRFLKNTSTNTVGNIMLVDEKRIKTIRKKFEDRLIFSKRTEEPILCVQFIEVVVTLREESSMAMTNVVYKKVTKGRVRKNAALNYDSSMDLYVADLVDEMLQECGDEEISKAVHETRKLELILVGNGQ